MFARRSWRTYAVSIIRYQCHVRDETSGSGKSCGRIWERPLGAVQLQWPSNLRRATTLIVILQDTPCCGVGHNKGYRWGWSRARWRWSIFYIIKVDRYCLSIIFRTNPQYSDINRYQNKLQRRFKQVFCDEVLKNAIPCPGTGIQISG